MKESYQNIKSQTRNKREQLCEQIQQDLLALTNAYLMDELDGYEDFEDKMCQIIVNNFKKS